MYINEFLLFQHLTLGDFWSFLSLLLCFIDMNYIRIKRFVYSSSTSNDKYFGDMQQLGRDCVLLFCVASFVHFYSILLNRIFGANKLIWTMIKYPPTVQNCGKRYQIKFFRILIVSVSTEKFNSNMEHLSIEK